MDTTTATLDGHHASCDMKSGSTWYNAVDVWYSYTAQANGLVEIRLSGCSSTITSSTASDLSLWGACGDASSIACSRTACSSLLSFPISAGNTYLIRAATFAISSSGTSAARRGTATLTFTEFGPPANDSCATALDVGTGPVPWNDSLAQADGPLPSCSSTPDQATQKDLWFAHTPAGNSAMVLTASGAIISVHDSCAGSTLACAAGSVELFVTGGTRYLIRIARPAQTPTGPGTLTIATYATPANDTCQTAQEVGPGDHQWDDSGAAANPPFSSCGTAGTSAQRDVWFAYTAATTGNTTLHCKSVSNASPQNTGATISVFTACDGSEIVCRSQSTQTRWACFSAVAGQRYLIRLGRASTGTREPWLLTINEYAPPGGDSCQNAVPLSLGTEQYSNTGVCDHDPLDTYDGCQGQTGIAYLWFVLIPQRDGVATFSSGTDQNVTDTVFHAYSACGGALLECSSNLGHQATPGSFIALPATTNVPIYLRVGVVTPYNNYYQSFLLTTDILDPLPNDDCAGALPLTEAGTTFDNRNALNSPGVPDPSCNSGSNLGLTRHDLWWTWTSPRNGTTRISTCRNPAPLLSADATVLTVYSACDLAQEISCNDDWGDPNQWAWPCTDSQSALSFHSTANTTYLVRVGAHREYLGPGVLNLFFIPDPCVADFNNSGSITVQDIFDFLAAYFAADPRADINAAGGITVQDIFDFLAAYFAGCP
jgi:hypothetical protein